MHRLIIGVLCFIGSAIIFGMVIGAAFGLGFVISRGLGG